MKTTMTKFRKSMKNQSGQGMTEYIIIVALIAIAAIGVVTLFGDNIRRMFGASVDALAGKDTNNTNAVKQQNSAKHMTVTTFGSQVTAR